jgi:sugar lactone lactonase YvrE
VRPSGGAVCWFGGWFRIHSTTSIGGLLFGLRLRSSGTVAPSRLPLLLCTHLLRARLTEPWAGLLRGRIGMLAGALVALCAWGCLSLLGGSDSSTPAMESTVDAEPPPVCAYPAADCDGVASNGCEIDLDADPANCGSCANSCFAGGCNQGACGSEPQELISGQTWPTFLLVDDSALYWTTTGEVGDSGFVHSGSVLTAALDGTDPKVLANGQPGPDGFAMNDNALFWTCAGDGSVMSVGKSQGAAVRLASHRNSPRAIALDSERLYWVDSGDRSIVQAKLDGTELTQLASADDAVLAIGVGSDALFFSTGSSVWTMTVRGENRALVASEQRLPTALVVDHSGVFWSNRGSDNPGVKDGSIAMAPLPLGPISALATGQPGPISIAADDHALYWTNFAGGTVMKLEKAGGRAVMLASRQAGPWGIAVDGQYVYWTSFAHGAIRRMPLESSASD